MRIDIITVLPELLQGPLTSSIVKRAQDKNLAEIVIHSLRDYSTNKHKTVDDYAFGGGAGMVLQPQPISDCIEKLLAERKYDEIIYMTPDGEILKQTTVNALSIKKNLMILAGHYKGVDQRIRDIYVTKEISIGDYVLTGGELPAAILADAIIRLIPGVLGDETSALTDSFQDNLLSPPVYTRPEEFKGIRVPDVLLSGNHKKIEEWRDEQALKRTQQRRPDLLD
ncbi:MAG: tRNA (guanosine(37)-N1)-methyltransferase TrmD [Flavobacteriales bacterium]|nr:tRNA (guanosine(37)-N1)-methyltransferase TrmD [Flavobacteriales bacterium]